MNKIIIALLIGITMATTPVIASDLDKAAKAAEKEAKKVVKAAEEAEREAEDESGNSLSL